MIICWLKFDEKQWNWRSHNIFDFFLYICWFLNLVVALIYQHFAFMYIWWFLIWWFLTFYQQKSQNFNKTAACSHHCPLWHEHRYWGIGTPGVYLHICDPGLSKSHHLPRGLLLRWLQVASIDIPMCVPIFNSTEKALGSLFMIIFSVHGQKCDIWRNL